MKTLTTAYTVAAPTDVTMECRSDSDAAVFSQLSGVQVTTLTTARMAEPAPGRTLLNPEG